MFVVGFEGRGGGKKRRKKKREREDGISGCRCVSFGLAVTSCFHTITNTAHPLTLNHQNKRKKSGGGGAATRKDTVFIYYYFFFLLFNVPYICETFTSQSTCCVLSLWFGVYHYLPIPPPSLNPFCVRRSLHLSTPPLPAFYNPCFFFVPPPLLPSPAHHTMDCFSLSAALWTVMELQCSVGLYMHRFFFLCFHMSGVPRCAATSPAARPYLSPPTQAWPKLILYP